MFYEETYRITPRDTDPFGQCRPSSLLTILQEAAADAVAELHASRAEIVEKYNCFWMLARIWYRLDKPLRWGEELTVRTWHRGGKGAVMYRDFDLYCSGEQIGEAVSTWVLADLDTHKLKRMSEISEFELTTGGDLCKSVQLHKVRLPAEMTPVEERLMHYSDTDINVHVNNTRYADFACDAIWLDQMGEGKFVSSLQISFLKECRAGEVITLSAGQQDGVWYAGGKDSTGIERFDAAISLKNIP